MERKNGVHQDRLVKKFRRKNISSYQAANVYLQAEYLPALNQRFAQNPARPEDYHRAKPSAAELDAVFRLETERWVSNDWVVRYNGRYLQLLPPRCCDGPRVKAQVYESPNGTLEVCYRGQPVAWEEILGPPAARGTETAYGSSGKSCCSEGRPPTPLGALPLRLPAPLQRPQHPALLIPPRGHFYRVKQGDISNEA